MSDPGVRTDEPFGGSGRPGLPIDPYRLFRALWSGKYWLIGAGLAGALIGYAWVKVMMGYTYEASAVLRYEGDPHIAGVDLVGGYPLGPAADALASESLLRKLQERIGYEGSLLGLRSAIGYSTDHLAGTVRVSALAATSEGAAAFVHEVTDVFLDYHRERQARRIELEMARVAKRIESAEQEAADARRRYNEFRELHGIADLSSEQKSLVNSTAKLRADSELAAAEVRALEVEVRTLEEQLASTPKTSTVSGSAPERAAYDQLRQELASARATLSPEHPRVQALEQQVNQLRAQLRSGRSGAGVVGANVTYQSLEKELRDAKSKLTTLRERQKGLAQLADKSQRRVESFSGVEGEASALLAEVEVNDALVAKLNGTEAALEDALEHPPSGFSVLDPGVAPEFPVASRQKKVVFLGVTALAGLAALLFVLWREFRGFRVETPREVAFWGAGPVLGVTSWPDDPLGLDELVAGLDDLAPDASGDVLIIGGASGDGALARELAQRMNDDWFLAQPQGQTSEPVEGPVPVPTPPASGPYPIGGPPRLSAAQTKPSTALALRPVQLVRRKEGLRLEAWDGPFEDQALRRAARLADRVIVLVRSREMTLVALNAVRQRIGRDSGIGFIVLSLPDALRGQADRIGDVRAFWKR